MIEENRIQMILERIEERYNSEKDIISGDLLVTWAEMDLCTTIKSLIVRIEVLEQKLKGLVDD